MLSDDELQAIADAAHKDAVESWAFRYGTPRDTRVIRAFELDDPPVVCFIPRVVGRRGQQWAYAVVHVLDREEGWLMSVDPPQIFDAAKGLSKSIPTLFDSPEDLRAVIEYVMQLLTDEDEEKRLAALYHGEWEAFDKSAPPRPWWRFW